MSNTTNDKYQMILEFVIDILYAKNQYIYIFAIFLVVICNLFSVVEKYANIIYLQSTRNLYEHQYDKQYTSIAKFLQDYYLLFI